MTSGLPVNLSYSPSAIFSGQRRADLPAERLRRHLRARRRAEPEQLVQHGQRHRPDRLERSRSATRRATSRAGRRSTCSTWACTRVSACSASSRLEFRFEAFNVLNKHQPRRAERQPSRRPTSAPSRRWRRRRGSSSSASSSTSDGLRPASHGWPRAALWPCGLLFDDALLRVDRTMAPDSALAFVTGRWARRGARPWAAGVDIRRFRPKSSRCCP